MVWMGEFTKNTHLVLTMKLHTLVGRTLLIPILGLFSREVI